MAKLGIFVLLVFLAAAIYFAYGLWTSVGPANLPPSLYVALALGTLFSLIVGCGLMALVFYSSRAGYDERAGHADDVDH
jgi:hypothetical protein